MLTTGFGVNWRASIGKLFLLIFLVLISEFGYAQMEKDSTGRHAVGLFFGYGGKDLKLFKLDIPYDYQIRIAQLDYSYTIIPRINFDLDLVISPQIIRNCYRYQDDSEEKDQGKEWGFTVGFAPKFYSQNRKFTYYVLVSSGPFYINEVPARQSNGFNFSSSFLAGISVKLFNDLSLDIRSGFRHTSNAEIRLPNRGLNVLIISSGISYAL